MQSASAGPGELLQVAVSLSAVLPIQIVPPGQVTDTIFSPAAHNSTHLVSQAASLRACKPAAPAGPGGPSEPAGPAGPTPPAAPAGPARPATPAAPGVPFSPCGPGGPAGPAGPCGPSGPAEPVGPGGPAGPWAPVGPSKHPDSEKAAMTTTMATNARITKLPLFYPDNFKLPRACGARQSNIQQAGRNSVNSPFPQSQLVCGQEHGAVDAWRRLAKAGGDSRRSPRAQARLTPADPSA
jgi:hypothetical protein